MAPANDSAGEILSSRLPATFPRRNNSLAIPNGTSNPMEDADVDADDDHASSSSSPPTHPAFFSPPRQTTKRRADASPSPGKENVCPAFAGVNSMAASFSPLGSPLAVLIARRASPSQKSAGCDTRARTSGSIVHEVELTPNRLEEADFIGDDRSDGTRGILTNVDMNIVASVSSDVTNGGYVAEVDSPQKRSSKQKKGRKNNKRSNGTVSEHGDDKSRVPSESSSYADAVKKDPTEVEEKDTKPSLDQVNGHSPGNDGESVQPTAAGNKTFAEALQVPAEKDFRSGVKRDSLASTAVDYPELHSDSNDDDEKEQRQRDKRNATEVLRMRWAPLRVPFRRRLQTLAVLFHCLCMGLALSLFFMLCAIIPLWPIIIAYLIYLLFATDGMDGKLRSRREWVRRLPIWTYFAEYFPAKLHKTHDLIPTRKYILGYHPHGIISHGAWVAFATEALGFADKFPGITNSLLTLDSNFRLPLYRQYVLSMGVQSVSKESIKNLLGRGGRDGRGMGRAVTVVVGGARESLKAQPNTMRLIIKDRKGFIKLALITGADLVPVIGFGENDLYDQLDPNKHPWLHNIQHYFLKVWKFTVPLLHGRGIFNYDVGLMPYRRPMNIVVGKPIPVFQNDNPDNKEIDRLHDLYTEELQKIWDRYKDEFVPHRKEEMEFMG